MIDREKIIKGLEYCTLQARKGWPYEPEITKSGCEVYECPYIGNCGDMLFDVLAMLKEQEAKLMIESEHGWNCPSCGMKLTGKTASGYPCDLIDLPEDDPIHFCPKCGQAVKWE